MNKIICITDGSSQFDITLMAVSVVYIALKWITLGVLFWTMNKVINKR